MSTSAVVPQPSQAWVPPVAEPLDELKWQSWLAKGREEERLSNGRCITAVKCLAIAVLLAAAGLWALLVPYAMGLRFVVTVSAIVVMVQAVRTRYYVAAAAFGVLVPLYNPFAPAIDFSANWQRVLVGATILPFAASLFWRAPTGKTHV